MPEHIKTFFLRDIKILHEEDTTNKVLFNKQSSRNTFVKMNKQKNLHRFILHPESQYRLFWDIVTALLVLILIWLIPFYIGFNTWSSDTMNSLSVFMDVWFIFDVFLNFRTGFVDHGATVMDSNKIAKHYLKSWFLIDFFASVPWEIFLAEGQDGTGSKTANKASRKSVKMSKYFKIPKLLRMARLLRAFNKYARFYALTLVVLGMLVTLHVGACLIAKALEICTGEVRRSEERRLERSDSSIPPSNDHPAMYLTHFTLASLALPLLVASLLAPRPAHCSSSSTWRMTEYTQWCPTTYKTLARATLSSTFTPKRSTCASPSCLACPQSMASWEERRRSKRSRL